MLNPSDVYVSGGPNLLYKCWTDKVTKFDSSSFYNWEHDNLPVLDLEERTNLLWERFGYPTSSLTGMSFVVSADAPAETCNGIYFRSLSSCLNALPDVINYPILIEVASFGDLGEINLSNKIAGPRGAIEIVNRNFGKVEPATNNLSYNAEHSHTGIEYSYASAVSITNSTVASIIFGGNDVPTLPINSIGAKIYSTNQLIASAAALDVRYTASNTTVFSRKTLLDNNSRLTAALASNNILSPFSQFDLANSYKMVFTPYETNPEAEDLIDTYDASCINELLNTEIVWETPDGFTVTAAGSSEKDAVSIAYFNKLSSISVKNCNIPLYIRNFYLDGGIWSGTDVGIDIKNSHVVLEQCAVSRFKKAGLRAVNSEVTLSRGFVAYRNYGFDSSGVRLGQSWNSKIDSYSRQNVYGAGILLENSNLTFSGDLDRDTALFTQSLDTFYPTFKSSFSAIPIAPYGWFYCLSKNDIGIYSINSTITGGKNELTGLATIDWYNANQIFIENNTEAGIRLYNTTMDMSGRLMFYSNFIGLDGVESKISVDSIYSRYNQKEAIKLKNSFFRYNKDLYSLYSNETPSFPIASRYCHQISLIENGTHLRATNSVFEPAYANQMNLLYDKFFASGSFGIVQDLSSKKDVLPGIIIENSSKVDLVHPQISVPAAYVENNKPIYGAAINADGGSEVILRGSGAHPTKILGPLGYTAQNKKSGLYATNGSKIALQGPSVLARWAIDALADNNSKIEITPHRNRDGSIAVSAFSLNDAANHTMVELHSTRACLVVDNGSVLEMEDLGDYYGNWNAGSYGSSILLSSMDYLTDNSNLGTSAYTFNGSLQFYPNPNDSAYYEGSPGIANPAGITDIYTPISFQTNVEGKYYFLNEGIGQTSMIHDFSSTTAGGMCVRATNNSNVKVNNVHFPCGWWNPSSVIYDVSSGASDQFCGRLFIWNIADNSLLNAKYCSVSSLHPRDAGYIGPSGTWSNLSGAPSSTADTGTLSVLDYYGRGTTNPYGKSTAENFGPFRLYWSIDPAANWLLTSSLTLPGFIPHVFAQGYNFSAPAIAPGSVSSEYTSLLRRNGSTLEASGFYYTSSMVASPNSIKAMLDDSAANTFANAKHNSVGKSGLCKTTYIYNPITGSYGGDSAAGSQKSLGRGVRSVNNFDLEKDN